MRIAPDSSHASTHSHLTSKTPGAPSAPGIHDTLRAGVGPSLLSTPLSTSSSTSHIPSSSHPLEARLKKWEETQLSLKMEGLRRTFGIAEPIRRGMELKVVREGEWRPACLGGGSERGVHEDILRGMDCDVNWEDVFKGDEMGRMEFHDEVERKVLAAVTIGP
ncbi:related to 20S proteasome maturation factor [Rhynchosporium secalis]|uniref:Related to 20S proteasome maturation factor n=1 Tax=Rhynchosporium secalis TaxID=38038 RepID=A0A1E1LZS2_RHYSE|nr:related to 20S proteasome maturation factor [Rhynchosporium secalis]